MAPAPDDPFCGNKWRKLKYNLADALATDPTPALLSFGGAYSNHIAALASAGRHLGLSTIGVIRGEEVQNPTLDRARADGMQLHFVDRATYRRKQEDHFCQELQQRFGPNLQIIPEGGSNARALPGCRELGKELLAQTDDPPTHILLACGTGGTLAGLALGLAEAPPQLLGVSVLKGDFLRAAVQDILLEADYTDPGNWRILTDFHHGGYARRPPELIEFIYRFHAEFGIRLDPIYTGKVAWALEKLIEQNYFPAGSRIVLIHTGGLQGAQDLWGVNH
jgi:1-aminocyclopropane-1-carboxylate deaminase